MSDDDTVQVNNYGNGRVVRYYRRDGAMRISETRNGRSLDMELQQYLLQDAWEVAKFFALGPEHPSVLPQYSIRESEPTNLGSP